MYVYLAIQRSKENANKAPTFREVHYDHLDKDDVISRLIMKTSDIPGVWRIYRSVNKRDERKTKLELIETLTKQLVFPNSVSNKNPESLWKDLLMQPRNKTERLFLIDVDCMNEAPVVFTCLEANQVRIIMKRYTPNGMHIVTEPFDPKIINCFEHVEIKKDGLLFVEKYEV